ncbi:ORF11R [Ictalurid herpesvirus 1]|nr:ORF11L [Ictalurid herpesvirus 1]QAB08572.1 ORF11R [Ictalurid herpesvirus 1]
MRRIRAAPADDGPYTPLIMSPVFPCCFCHGEAVFPSNRASCKHVFCFFCTPRECPECGSGGGRKLIPNEYLYALTAKPFPPAPMGRTAGFWLMGPNGGWHVEPRVVVLEDLLTAVILTVGALVETRGVPDGAVRVRARGKWEGAIALPPALLDDLVELGGAIEAAGGKVAVGGFLVRTLYELVVRYHDTLARTFPVMAPRFGSLGALKELLSRFRIPGYFGSEAPRYDGLLGHIACEIRKCCDPPGIGFPNPFRAFLSRKNRHKRTGGATGSSFTDPLARH